MSRSSTTLNSGRGAGGRRRRLPPRRLAAALLASAALLIVVGLATHANVEAGSSSPSNGGIGLVFDVLVLGVVLGTFIVGFLAVRALMGERFHGRAPFQVSGARPKWSWKERIVVVLIVAVLAGGAIAAFELTHQLRVTRRALPTLANLGKEAAKVSQHVNWGLAAGAGAGAAALILGGGILFLSLRDRRSGELAPLQAAEVGLKELQAEFDPRRAVIRAYAGMEGSLSEQGVARRPAEAPFEYLGRVLIDGGASRLAATRLTELFEQARFSPHEIGSELKTEALHALVDVRQSIRAVLAAPVEQGP